MIFEIGFLQSLFRVFPAKNAVLKVRTSNFGKIGTDFVKREGNKKKKQGKTEHAEDMEPGTKKYGIRKNGSKNSRKINP